MINYMMCHVNLPTLTGAREHGIRTTLNTLVVTEVRRLFPGNHVVF